MHPHLGRNSKFISMFLDEARLSAQLSHSNCVQVFDIGVRDDAYFIVMEFVDGANLSYAHELVDRNGMPLNLVHRDVSPPNVLVTKHGEVKIVDFGLAKASSQIEPSEPGIIKGKFAYLSPEAALGEDIDCRTDIFAVGIILWELLASQRLFTGDRDVQILHKVQTAQIRPISQINRSVPPELESIVNRALARDRNKLIEEALFEFTSLRGDTPLNEDLFADSPDPADLPAVEQGNLAALEGDDVPSVPSQHRRLGLVFFVLLVLAALALAWFTL